MAVQMKSGPVLNDAPRVRTERILKQWMQDGTLPAGQPLPTEQTLANELQVSRGTLRGALDSLTTQGLIRSNGGRLRIVVAVPPRGAAPAVAVRDLDASSRSGPVANFERADRAQIGIVGAWTGQPQHYIWNNWAMRAMEKTAAAQAHVTLAYFNRFQGMDEPRLPLAEGIATLKAKGIDRIAVLSDATPREIVRLASSADIEKMRVVFLQEEGPNALPVCQVTHDIEHSGFQAADHLIRRGWGPLVMLAPFDTSWLWKRFQGVERAVQMHVERGIGLTVWPSDTRPPLGEVQGILRKCGYETGRQLFATMSLPCGIIAPNDMTAYGLLDAAGEAGLTSGVDFGLIGFDDDPQSRDCGLSSLRPPIEAMGEEAIRLLLLGGSVSKNTLQTSFRSEMVARDSSAFQREAEADFYAPVATGVLAA